MKTAVCYLKSTSPYAQSKYHTTEKNNKEGHDEYEERTWRERSHYNEKRELFIPCHQFSQCIKSAAKYLSIQIPGKGKSTYTKNFASGIIVDTDVPLGVLKDDAEKLTLHVPSDGRPGGSTRVIKHFPMVKQWEGKIAVTILDDIIRNDVFEQVLRSAGVFIGIGAFRPANRGVNGRFEVEQIKWTED